MYLKYHMANKTYFTTYLTFNKQIDQCKQKLTPKSFYEIAKENLPSITAIETAIRLAEKILRF